MAEGALSYAIPVSIELAGIFVLLIGIAVEISMGAGVGHILISVGSAVIAVGNVLWAKILKVKGKRR
jgi:FtsH-binding integral membrane protein